MATSTVVGIKKNRGIRHTASCVQETEPTLLGLLALKQLMWTCPDCGRMVTVNPMDDDNPWERGR